MIGRLHVLTDTVIQRRYSHAELARHACRGGADVIQFREKRGPDRTRLAGLEEVARVCREEAVQLIVDDALDLALAVDADGVHLGQDDLPVSLARRVLQRCGSSCLIGATCTTAEQVRRAAQAGADYIGFGPVFPTSSKDNRASVKGLDGLAAACRAASIPVIAIGGMTAARVPSVLEAGAHGVAVLSAIVAAADVQRATEAFRVALDAG